MRPRLNPIPEISLVRNSSSCQLTQGICDQIQRLVILLHHIRVQSSQVEAIQNVVLVDLGKVLLHGYELHRPSRTRQLTLPLVVENQEIHLSQCQHRSGRLGMIKRTDVLEKSLSDPVERSSMMALMLKSGPEARGSSQAGSKGTKRGRVSLRIWSLGIKTALT